MAKQQEENNVENKIVTGIQQIKKVDIGKAKEKETKNSTAQELSAQKQLTQALNNASNSLTTSENNSVKKSETFVYYKCIQEKEGKKEDIGLKTEVGDGYEECTY